jgi:hypothetical protein
MRWLPLTLFSIHAHEISPVVGSKNHPLSFNFCRGTELVKFCLHVTNLQHVRMVSLQGFNSHLNVELGYFMKMSIKNANCS